MISHIPTSIYHNCFINGLLANQITALIISPSISFAHVLWTHPLPSYYYFHLLFSPLCYLTDIHNHLCKVTQDRKNPTITVISTAKDKTLLVLIGNLPEWIPAWQPRHNMMVVTQFGAELWKRNSQHKAISMLASNLRRKDKNWQAWKENHLSHLYWKKQGC